MMDVRMPDGTVIKNVPDNYSQEDLLSQYQQYSKPSEEKFVEPAASKPAVAPPADFAHSEAAKYLAPVASAGVGLAKPIAGAAEYLGIGAPARYLNQASQELIKMGGMPSQIAELGGEVLSPVPTKLLGLASKGMKYAPMAAKGLEDLFKESVLAKSAAQGATAAALNPTDTTKDQSYTDFLGKKAEQVGLGGATGAALGKAGQVALNPKVTAEVQKLKDLGMKYFTPGQLAGQVPMIGKLLHSIEQKATSLPIAGGIVEQGLKTSAGDFNRALGNEVLKPMGQTLPKTVKPGEDMISYLNDRIENAYDTITPKLSLKNVIYNDPASPTGITSTVKKFNDKLAEVTQGLPSAKGNDMQGMVHDEFDKHILNPLYRLTQQNGQMTGEEFRAAEKNLGRTAFNYMKNPATYDVGAALKDLQGELRKELANQNPALAKELNGIHQAFIRHLPVERAASYVGAQGRVFTPSQFESAVKAETKGKGRFASGQSTFYPESQAALNVLGRTSPDSGTAARAGVGALLTGGGYGAAGIPGAVNALALPAIGAGALYNQPVMGALTKLATERPEFMKRAAPAVQSGLSTLGGFAASNSSGQNP
jgi:hypothetical protein